MPVPKKYTKTYRKIVGHMINQGTPSAVAKKKTDKAIADMAKKDKAKAKGRKKKGG